MYRFSSLAMKDNIKTMVNYQKPWQNHDVVNTQRSKCHLGLRHSDINQNQIVILKNQKSGETTGNRIAPHRQMNDVPTLKGDTL